jgi:uncharacterized protein YbbC (DUF1343 family)
MVVLARRLLASTALHGVGWVVSNPASSIVSCGMIADHLAVQPNARLAALFGPQHGFRSRRAGQHDRTRHAHDEVRRVPVYSLYSDVASRPRRCCAISIVLVIDLQDVGVRIYTYIYTMANCLRRPAARASK